MGLDWRVLDLSDYMEALEAFNAMNDPEADRDVKQPSPAVWDYFERHRNAGQ